jgi:hypothetical protein
MQGMEIVIIAFLAMLLLAFWMFRVYKDKTKSVVEKIFECTFFLIGFAVVYMWAQMYIWGDPFVPGYELYTIPPTRFLLIMMGVVTFAVVYKLCQHLIMLRLKRPTFFPLDLLAMWSFLWTGLVVEKYYRRDVYTPESVYISPMLLGTSLVVACLCLWIFIIDRKEHRRRMKGTNSPPSNPAA